MVKGLKSPSRSSRYGCVIGGLFGLIGGNCEASLVN